MEKIMNYAQAVAVAVGFSLAVAQGAMNIAMRTLHVADNNVVLNVFVYALILLVAVPTGKTYLKGLKASN